MKFKRENKIEIGFINKPIFGELAKLFIEMRKLYSFSGARSAWGTYDVTVAGMKNCRTLLKKESNRIENKLFVYYIDTMLRIIKEGNVQKIYDYADAVHCIPEYIQDEEKKSHDARSYDIYTEFGLISFCNRMLFWFCEKYGTQYYYNPPRSVFSRIRQFLK